MPVMHSMVLKAETLCRSCAQDEHKAEIRGDAVGTGHGIAFFSLRSYTGKLSVKADPGRGHHRSGWSLGPRGPPRRRPAIAVAASADDYRKLAGRKRWRRSRTVREGGAGRTRLN